MNKLFTFLASAALVGSFTACSSDEPAKGPDQGTTGEKSTMYLAVNISDANSMSRALENDNEWEFKHGDEHTVSSAHFFFFDAKGIYIAQANVWKGDKEGADKDNIEYLGKNVLILEGLTEKNLPKYVVTVLNAPEALTKGMLAGVSTIEELKNYPLDSYLNGSNYIMSTSSFRGGDTSFYTDKYYYANLVPDGYLKKEPVDLSSDDKVLDIYVERLAAKYTLATGSHEFKVKMTVAGEANNDLNTEDDIYAGETELKVTVTGFGVTTTEKKSWLSKNLDGFANNANIGTWNFTGNNSWNDANNHRSYWGQSFSYGLEANVENYDHSLYAASVKNGLTQPVYSLENTNTVSKITRATTNPAEVDASLVTNFVFTATITNADGSAITDLIRYNGVLFKNDQFMKYVLRSVQEDATKGLNFYKQVTNTSETDDKGITDNNQTYVQISPADFKFVKAGNGGKMSVEFNYDGDLYSYDATASDGEKFTKYPESQKATIDQYIKDFIGANTPVRYNGGSTVYTVPVEHLLGTDNKYTITNEGEFGVVRNHWYEITLNSISKIGQGVFNPNEGEDGDRVYPDPDPDPDTYGMAASIKILSWKIVKQTVDL